MERTGKNVSSFPHVGLSGYPYRMAFRSNQNRSAGKERTAWRHVCASRYACSGQSNLAQMVRLQ
jgi:hypothetical protein